MALDGWSRGWYRMKGHRMAEHRTGSGQGKHDRGLIARAKCSRVIQRGAHFLQFAIVTPALGGLMLMIAEPVMVMHRYNGVHHMLTEIADDARGNADLQGDFWNTGVGDVYNKFTAARLELSERFESELGWGVTARTVRHLDRVRSSFVWEDLKLGYLPPTTSAIVPAWNEGVGNSAPLNNSHACGVVLEGHDVALARQNFSARSRGEGHHTDEDIPRREAVGARGDCRIKEVKSSELSSWQSLPSASTKVPTELSAAVEIKGIFGTYPMTVTVPFFPRIPTQTSVQACTPQWTVGAWSPWTSGTCGPITRTRTDTDSCSNSRDLVETSCQACWANEKGWPLGSNNNGWSPTCQSDGKRRQARWERDTGGCSSPVTKNHSEVAGCNPGEVCGWTTKTGTWSTMCDSAGRKTQDQWSENACGEKKDFSTNYQGGWTRTSTGSCSSSCGGGTLSYTETDSCGTPRAGTETCNTTHSCCDAHRLDLKKEGTGGVGTRKTVLSGDPNSCLSTLIANYEAEARSWLDRYSYELYGFYLDENYVDDLTWRTLAFHLTGTVFSLRSTDYLSFYLSADCTRVIPASSVNNLCSHVQYGWKVSPISLVWDEREAESDKELVVAQFPLFAEPEKGWVVWKASGRMPLLVRDPEGRGMITSGEQLFGSRSFGGKPGGGNWEHGFEALGTLDSDKDGKVSGGELTGLALWFDENRDAVSQPGEVKPLSDPSIGVTELFYKDVKRVAEDGDVVAEIGFSRTGASGVVTGKAIDWFTEGGSSRQQLVNQLVASSNSGAEHAAAAESVALPEPKNGAPVASSPTGGAASRKIVSSPLNGLWVWKADGERSKEIANEELNGVLLFADLGEGEIAGRSIVEVPFIEGAPYRGQITSISFSGKSKKQAGKPMELSFSVFPGGEKDKASAVSTVAILDEKSNTLRGTSRAQVMYEGKLRQISYSWTAKKRGAGPTGAAQSGG